MVGVESPFGHALLFLHHSLGFLQMRELPQRASRPRFYVRAGRLANRQCAELAAGDLVSPQNGLAHEFQH
jgi:hypothetical protein